jgi:hypothetical protein
MADTTGGGSTDTRRTAPGDPTRGSTRRTWTARVVAIAALGLLTCPPALFTLINHGECYGAGPVLLDAVAWAQAEDTGACCDAPLVAGPASPLARSLLGAEVLWFLFTPVAAALARVLGWLRIRESAAVVSAVVALHLGTLALGDRSIGGAFTIIGTSALKLASFTYVAAWLVTVAFARGAPGAPALPQSTAGRRWALSASALAALAVPAWLFLSVANRTSVAP